MRLSISDIYYYVLGDRAVISHKKKDPQEQKNYENKVKEKIRLKFEEIIKGQMGLKFREVLREIENKELEIILFDNDTDILPPPSEVLLSQEKIAQSFHNLNDKYGFFDESDTTIQSYFTAFSHAYQLLTFHNGKSDISHCELAYKSLVYFGISNKRNIFSNIEKFLKKHAGNDNQALNAILVNELPIYDKSIDLIGWQKLLMQHGKSIFPLFSISPTIMSLLPSGHFSLQEAKRIAAQLYYARGSEHPLLAELCHQYRVGEMDFNRCLDVLEPMKKERDNLPDIFIDGKEVNFPGYYLVKLPIDDIRIYVLGQITNNCARIGGEGEQCIIDAISRENCGFYVLLKAYQAKKDAPVFVRGNVNYDDFALVGHGYAWISKFNNLTFDSWENQRPAVDDSVIVSLLNKFCQVIAEDGKFKRVTIGLGGKTPKIFSQKRGVPEIIKEGMQCFDSYTQGVLLDSLSGDKDFEKYKALLIREIDDSETHTLAEKEVFKKLLEVNINYKLYFDMVRELFFYSTTVFSWSQLFKKPDIKENLISSTKEKGALFLDLLLKLKTENLLTHETYLLLIENIYVGMWVMSALSLLQPSNIEITTTTFAKCIHLAKVENDLERVIKLVKQAYELTILNTDIFTQIINLSENMDNILAVECLIDQLTKNKILDNEVLILLFSNLSVGREICAMTILLTHAKKLTKDNILTAILYCNEYKNNLPLLWEGMDCFHDNNFIDQANFQYFFMLDEYSDQLKIENMIIVLSYLDMLNKKMLALVFEAARQCDSNDFIFMISVFENLRLAFKCKEEDFLYLLERPKTSIALFKKLNEVSLLNLYVWDVIVANLPYMEDIVNALVKIKKNALEHVRKDIFQDFMEYFHMRTDCVDRTKIVYEWALDYMRFKQENPFALLDKADKKTNFRLFSHQENASALFKKFIVGGPPHPELLSLLSPSSKDKAIVAMETPSLRMS